MTKKVELKVNWGGDKYYPKHFKTKGEEFLYKLGTNAITDKHLQLLIDKFPSFINHFRRENAHLDRIDRGSGRHAVLFQITGHQLPDLGMVVDDKDMRLRGHNQSGSARTARRIAILSPLSSGWVQAR